MSDYDPRSLPDAGTGDPFGTLTPTPGASGVPSTRMGVLLPDRRTRGAVLVLRSGATLPPGGDPNPLKPTPAKSLRAGEQRVETFNPQDEPIPVIYGATRVGAAPWYWQLISATGRFLVLYVVCHGPVNSISNITIDGQTLAQLGLTNGVDYQVFTGTTAQALSTIMSGAVGYTSAHPGLAYVVVHFKAPTAAIPAVDVNRFQCDVQGMLIRDPRTDPTLVNRYYRDNPALCLADLMTSAEYGAEIPDSAIDWLGSVTASANFCDFAYPSAPAGTPTLSDGGAGGACTAGAHKIAFTAVTSGIESQLSTASAPLTFTANHKITIGNIATGPGGTTARKIYMTKAGGSDFFLLPASVQALFADNVTTGATFDPGPDSGFGTPPNFQGSRYRIGLALQNQDTFDNWVKTIRAHAQLFLAYNSGIFQIVADQAQSATSVVLTDQGSGANILKGAYFRVKGAAERPTHVIVHFTDSANSYKDGTAEVEDPGIAAGTVERITQTFDLFGIPTFDMARRIAIYLLNRNVQDKEVTIPVNAEGAQILPGNVVTVTSAELNLASQLVVVTEVVPNGIGWTVSGELYSASTYSDVLQTTTVQVPPASPSPYTTPPNPTWTSLTEVSLPDSKGIINSKLKCVWAAPASGFVNRVRVVVNNGTDTYVLGEFTKDVTTAYIENPRFGQLHTITLYSLTTADIPSSGTALTITPVLTGTSVPDPVGASITSLGYLRFTGPTRSTMKKPLVAPTVSTIAGGGVTVGTHDVAYSYITAAGEGPICTPVSVSVSGGNKIVKVDLNETPPSDVLVLRFYFSLAGSSTLYWDADADPSTTSIQFSSDPSSSDFSPPTVYDYVDGWEILDDFGSPTTPPVIRVFDVDSMPAFFFVNMQKFAHADATTGKPRLDLIIKTKGLPVGARSPGISISKTDLVIANDRVAIQYSASLADGSNLSLSNGDNNDVVVPNVISRVTGLTAAGAITGIANPLAGMTKKFHNTTAQNLTFKHENAGSAAANRFKLAGGTDVVLTQDQAATFWYDSTDSRWRREQ